MFSTLIRRGRTALLTASVLMVGMVAGALPAGATPPAPDAAISGAFDSVQTMFLTVIVPAVVGLTVAVLGIVLAIKWIRKTAKTA